MTHRSDIYLANIIFPLHTWLFCVQCTVQSTGVQLFPLICVCREIVPANGHDLPTEDGMGILTGPSGYLYRACVHLYSSQMCTEKCCMDIGC